MPSRNVIIERCHCTIKQIAARTQCSIREALYWYNETPKNDATAMIALANSLCKYQICVKGVNVAPQLEDIDPRIYRVEDTVWIKVPHGRCTMQFKKGRVTEEL